ncbi:MAG: hypothetical protein RRB13_15100 [bacterium]|nr:hypothetical protein [bacterium]
MLRLILWSLLLTPWALQAEPLRLSLDPPGAGSQKASYESSHAPKMMRKYWVHGQAENLSAQLLTADGVQHPLVPVQESGASYLSFKTGFMDGPLHGVNQLYAQSRRVEGPDLRVETAQWYNVNHSCGWGHPFRAEPEGLAPKASGIDGLELLVEHLWDGNLHKSTEAGDQLQITALLKGKPVAGVELAVTTGSGWSKGLVSDEQGRAQVQLIGDYFPGDWSRFKARHQSSLLITARYQSLQAGTFENQPYQSINYQTSLPWNFTPERSGYQKYETGALLGFGGFLASGLGVFFWRFKRRRW